MHKVMIVGSAHSGKSCYFYAMMKKMMLGIDGLSIGADQKDSGEIYQNIKKLSNVKLPLAQRFPPASKEMRTYPLNLMYNFAELEKFDWVDYPGEMVSNSEDDFVALLNDADCLLVCVDGEKIQEDPEELDALADELVVGKWDCLSLNNALNIASQKNENFPPVCIMITKYDKLEPEFRNKEILLKLLKKVFPVLFHFRSGSGKDCMVSICPVTLGNDLDLGARMDPKNVEIPICFTIMMFLVDYMHKIQKAVTEFDRRKPIWIFDGEGAWVPSNGNNIKISQEIYRQQIDNFIQEIQEIKEKLAKLLINLPTFINGEEINYIYDKIWRE